MIIVRAFIIAVIATAAATGQVPAPQPRLDSERPILAEFARRVNAYVAIKSAAAATVLPLVPLRDPAEIRRRTEALATVIQSARWPARQGEIFTPEIAQAIRRTIQGGCDGDFAMLLALTREELTEPLLDPTIHARWPAGVPVPTMPVDMLAALPPLPPDLQYRFVNRALVLIDIDANLIIDFVPDAIPVITESGHAH